MKLQVIVLSAFLLFAASVAEARGSMSLTVDGVRRYFRSGEKPVQTITVSNTDPQGRSFLVTAKLIERLEKNPNGTWKERVINSEIMLAPKRFTLKHGEKKKLRLVNAQPASNEEKRYLLSFKVKPYTADAPWDDENAESVGMGIGVVVMPGMLIYVSPQQPKSNLVWNRTESAIEFENKGNTEIELRRQGNYCSPEDETICFELPGKRLEPKEKWVFNVAPSVPIQWHYQVYDKVVGKPFEIPAYD